MTYSCATATNSTRDRVQIISHANVTIAGDGRRGKKASGISPDFHLCIFLSLKASLPDAGTLKVSYNLV